MKGFLFRLEPVLGVREFSLERARLRLAEDVVAYERARDEEAKAADAARATEQALAARLREGVDAAEVRAVAVALADRRLGWRTRHSAAAALAQVEEARERVRGRMRPCVRSRSCAKAFASYKAQWRRREQRELDESP